MIPYFPSSNNFSNLLLGGAVLMELYTVHARLGPLSANRSGICALLRMATLYRSDTLFTKTKSMKKWQL